MASGKRASMREGPLAALFRRTDEDTEPPRSEPERREAPPEQRPDPRSLREDADEHQPQIPTAKERLTAAFSHDIPQDVLERPTQR